MDALSSSEEQAIAKSLITIPEIKLCFSKQEMTEIIEKLDNSELSRWVDSATTQIDEHALEMPEMIAMDVINVSEEEIDIDLLASARSC